MKNLKLFLSIISACNYDDGFSHFSSVEINRKFGIGIESIPKLLKELVSSGDIENHTVNGFYNRYKIINKRDCPKFILDSELNKIGKDKF